jgi:Fic family protein
VEGSLTTFPAPQEIDGLVGDFTIWLAAQPLDAKTAIAAHERLVSIQPFEDGNGRTARLVMNLLLQRAGYPLLVVRAEDRAAYHAALEAVQLGGPSLPYEAFMAERLQEAFAAY